MKMETVLIFPITKTVKIANLTANLVNNLSKNFTKILVTLVVIVNVMIVVMVVLPVLIKPELPLNVYALMDNMTTKDTFVTIAQMFVYYVTTNTAVLNVLMEQEVFPNVPVMMDYTKFPQLNVEYAILPAKLVQMVNLVWIVMTLRLS